MEDARNFSMLLDIFFECSGLHIKCAILIADLLSQNSWTGDTTGQRSSRRIAVIHKASHGPWASARNSALADDRETTFCFLLLHVIRLPPRNVQ